MGFGIKEIMQMRKKVNPVGEGLIITPPVRGRTPQRVGEIRGVTPGGKAVVDIMQHIVRRGIKREEPQVERIKTGRIVVDVNDKIFH